MPENPSLPVPDYVHPVEVFVVAPQRQRYWLHILLMLLTLLTTTMVGSSLQYSFSNDIPIMSSAPEAPSLFPVVWLWHEPRNILLGVPFSLTLLGILLAHEMGHYYFCLRYGIQATLPYFIPAPTLIGTLGAFIRIKSRIYSRAALFDIGIAGPIAGFIAAVPVLISPSPQRRRYPATINSACRSSFISYMACCRCSAARFPCRSRSCACTPRP
jgi:hypothetical protein